MKRIWLVLIGVVAFVLVLGIGAAAGGAGAYLLLRDDIMMVSASPASSDAAKGVIISYVTEGDPAAQAGIVRGDILLSIDNQETNTFLELSAALKSYDPGDEVALTVLHGDDQRTLSVELGEKDGKAYLGISTCGGSMAVGVWGDGNHLDLNKEIEILNTGGALITEVIEDSPASEADLQVGDVILSVNEDEVTMDTSLADLIKAYNPGDLVKLVIRRVEKEMEIEVRLGENPDKDGQAYLGVYYSPARHTIWLGEGDAPSFFDEELGLPLGEGQWMPFLHREFPELPHFESLPEGVDSGVVISEVVEDSPAQDAGLKEHDLILNLDGDSIRGLESFIQDIQSRNPGEQIRLTVLRGLEEIEINVTLGEHPDDPDQGYLGVKLGGFIKITKEGQDQDGLKFKFDEEIKLPGGDA